MRIVKTEVISYILDGPLTELIESFEDLDLNSLQIEEKTLYFDAKLFESVEESEEGIILYLTNGNIYHIKDKNILNNLLIDLQNTK